MSVFTDLGISTVLHYTPLHYLPWICRSSALKSKPVLRAEGYGAGHFRSKSNNSDIGRGFGEYAFLTVTNEPRILAAKLRGGFPHVELQIPTSVLEKVEFDLCRYNVAMARRLTTSPTGGYPESSTNGRYYDGKKIPIARTEDDQKAMVECHYGKKMIEVLVPHVLSLGHDVTVRCFDERDEEIISSVIAETACPWKVTCSQGDMVYPRNAGHVAAVKTFIDTALSDTDWRGDGLEYDRV